MDIEVVYDPEHSHPEELLGEVVWQEIMGGIVDDYPRSEEVTFYTIILYADNDRTWVVYIQDRDRNPINLTGATVIMTIKETKDGPVVIQKSTANPSEGAIGAANKGECYFYIVPSDTASITIRQYVFDVKVFVASGKEYTALEGVLNLLDPVNP